MCAPAPPAPRAPADPVHQARVALLGELMASIAHEVTQPLAAVVASGDAGMRWLRRAEPNVDEAIAAFSIMIAEARRAGDIVAGTRAMAAKAPGTRVTTDVNGLIKATIALGQQHLAERGCRLALDLTPDLPTVQVEPIQIQQVILNLIVNAVQALDAVEPADRTVLVRARARPDGVAIEVHDTGSGVTPDVGDRVFEPFYTTKSAGMGMGLAIARTIAQAHHGALSLEASPLGGAAFVLSLPAG